MASTAIKIGPADQGRSMTLEEFRDAEEEEGYRYELARGVLEVSEVPDDLHKQVVCNLMRIIARYDFDHPGLILNFGGGSEHRLWIPEMISGRNPDLGIVFRGTPPDDRGRRQPSLVAEVVSVGGEQRDYDTKRPEYLIFGIREYWIIDPRQRRMTVLIRRDEPGTATWSEKMFRDAELIGSELLPGLSGRVSELWIDTDLIEPESVRVN